MWSEQDSSQLRTFLQSQTGLNFLQELLERRPDTDGKSIESYALSAAEKEGWEREFNLIETLSRYKESQDASSPYIDTSKLD